MSADLTFTVVADDDSSELEKNPQGQVFHLGKAYSPPGSEPLPEAEAESAVEPEIEIVRVREGGGNDAIEALQEQYEKQKAQAEQIAIAERQWRLQTDEALARARDRDEVGAEYYNEGQRIEDAKARYADASYYGRHAEMAEIAEEIVTRSQYRKQLEGAHENLNQMAVLPPPPQQQTVSDPIEAWISTAGANLLDADKNYIRARRDFLLENQDAADILISAARLAEKRYGLQPGSEEYHRHLDEAIGLADEPDYTPARPVRQARQQGGTTTRRPVAAPGSRASSRSPGGKVHLSEFDMDQAKQLGMSFTDYAKIKSVANKREGQLTRQEAGGRLHARFSIEDHY